MINGHIFHPEHFVCSEPSCQRQFSETEGYYMKKIKGELKPFCEQHYTTSKVRKYFMAGMKRYERSWFAISIGQGRFLKNKEQKGGGGGGGHGSESPGTGGKAVVLCGPQQSAHWTLFSG